MILSKTCTRKLLCAQVCYSLSVGRSIKMKLVGVKVESRGPILLGSCRLKELVDANAYPWGEGVQIAALDGNGLIAVDKPAGILSHPNRKGEASGCLLNVPYDEEVQAFQLGRGPDADKPLYLLNRLDSATSGLLLMTVNERLRDLIRDAFEKRRIRKVYEALVFGTSRREGSNLWKDRLSVSKSQGGLRATVGSGVTAETKLLSSQPIPGIPVMSLLTLSPQTGRTHQLRIQASKRGLPIVGDRTYGNFAKNKHVARSKGLKRLCLHCTETSVEYVLGGKKFHLEAISKRPF